MKAMLLGTLMLVALCVHVRAQQIGTDTLPITMEAAENRFLQNNLQLLATKYNVEAQRAMIIQAKLWSNPNLNYQQSIYNDQTKKWFPTGTNDGQFSVGITQLINIAGQRNKRIKIEKINTEIAEYGFYDLLRTLKYQLHTDFFSLAYDIRSLKVYNQQISSLQQMTEAYREQLAKGNVAEKEVIRLQALLLSLQTEQKDLNNEVIHLMSDFRVLMADTTGTYFMPQVVDGQSDTLDATHFTLPQLTALAQSNRYDLKAGEAGIRRDNENIRLQKSLGVPDLTVGVDYERNSSFPNNYYGLGLNMDLPFVNHNQGNIKAAKYLAQGTEKSYELTKLNVDEDVLTAFEQAIEADRLYKNTDKTFAASYEKLMAGIEALYAKHNIGLVEFIDYYQSYKDNMVQWNKLQADRLNAFEQLDFVTGTDNFKH